LPDLITEDLFDDKTIAHEDDQVFNNHYRDADFFYSMYYGKQYNMGFQSLELRLFENKPVFYELYYDIPDFDITIHIKTDFYYDKIPTDNPALQDYQ
jgi:hypothetical protein